LIKQVFLALSCAIFCTVAQGETEQSGDKPVVYLTFDDGPSSDDVTDRVLAVLERYEADDQKIVDELYVTDVYVRAAGVPELSCFRAPFGVTNARVDSIAESMGLQSVGWTIDTRDWDPYSDEDYLARQLEDSRHESVVLMHDGPSLRWRTLQVFSNWMEESAHLYQFEALPECVQPAPAVFADLDAPLPAYTREEVEKVDETIPELIAKLRNYEITLDAEVVAQIDSDLSAQVNP